MLASLVLKCFALEAITYWMTHREAYLCNNRVGSTCICKNDLPTPYCRKETIGCESYSVDMTVSALMYYLTSPSSVLHIVMGQLEIFPYLTPPFRL